MDTMITTERLVPVTEVCKRIGVPQGSIKATHHDWAERPCITETDAARLLDEQRAASEANRRRKQADAARQAREREQFERNQDRLYWTAYAAVIQYNDPTDAKINLKAASAALAVVSSDDPENELARVIKAWGEPSPQTIMYVTGHWKGERA